MIQNFARCFIVPALILGMMLWPSEDIHAQNAQLCEQRFTHQGDKEWSFVRESLLYNEFSGYDGVVTLWTKPVAVEILSLKKKTYAVVRDVITILNVALDGSGMALSLADPENGNIVIMTNDRGSILEIMKEGDYDVPMGPTDAFTSLHSAPDHSATIAEIYIQNDVPDPAFEAAISQELFQAMGAANDTPYFPQSVMYEDGPKLSTSTRPSPIDLKLLRFMYLYLSPGDDECAVKTAYDQHWDSIILP